MGQGKRKGRFVFASRNNGIVSRNNGIVNRNNGIVSRNNGIVNRNNGIVNRNNGIVSRNNGILNKYVQGVRVFSMRRSGMSHITATRTYSIQANHEFTKASGIATAYNTIDILPLKSRPTAIANVESLP